MATTINPSDQTITQYTVQVGGANNLLVNVGPGSVGQVLQSGGNAGNPAYSTPTYPSASGTARTILVSDGTNNVYSTETWAAPGSSGNVLTSNGTNWLSMSPVYVKTALITLTNSQLKNINSTPITLIPAAGSNTVIFVLGTYSKFIYGGNNAFTGSNSLVLQFGGTFSVSAQIGTIVAAGTMIGTSTSESVRGAESLTVGVTMVNTAVTASAAANYAGNAANDNIVVVSLSYVIMTTT